jgi:hypothetical protein
MSTARVSPIRRPFAGTVASVNCDAVVALWQAGDCDRVASHGA